MTNKDVKTYKNYLEGLISSNNIDERDINIWCDIIEMLCFTNKDKVIFREDIERNLESFVDGGIQLASLKEISSQMGFDIDDNHIFSNNGDMDWGSDDSSKSDLLNQITNVWFTHLELRQKSFGDFYPFKIDKSRNEISCKRFFRLTKSNKLYLYFLLTSIRGGLDRSKQKRLEFDFEPIAFQSFKSLIPKKGQSYLMGKGSHTSDQFRTNKFTKFKTLADSLKVQIKVTSNYFSPKDSGENGIDFIGWLSFNDNLPNNFVFSGQATCMAEWNAKYNESSKQELGGILDISRIGSYTNILFIPYHFKVGNNWAYPTYIEAKDFLLFDRFRILNNLSINTIQNNLIPSTILKAIAA